MEQYKSEVIFILVREASLDLTLCEKCPNMEFFLLRIGENTDRIWTHFTQCDSIWMSTNVLYLPTYIKMLNYKLIFVTLQCLHNSACTFYKSKYLTTLLRKLKKFFTFTNSSFWCKLNYSYLCSTKVDLFICLSLFRVS